MRRKVVPYGTTLGLVVADTRRCNTMRKWCNFWYNETLRILVLCSRGRYVQLSSQRDMNDALVSAQKYDNAEAATLIIIIFPYGQCYFASALTYFCAKTSALYLSRSVDIQAYLLQKQGTSIHGVACLWYSQVSAAAMSHGWLRFHCSNS